MKYAKGRVSTSWEGEYMGVSGATAWTSAPFLSGQPFTVMSFKLMSFRTSPSVCQWLGRSDGLEKLPERSLFLLGGRLLLDLKRVERFLPLEGRILSSPPATRGSMENKLGICKDGDTFGPVLCLDKASLVACCCCCCCCTECC